MKDLGVIKDADLKDIIIVDNSEKAFAFQPENGIQIKEFSGGINDKELQKLMWFLMDLEHVEDVRVGIKSWVNKGVKGIALATK